MTDPLAEIIREHAVKVPHWRINDIKYKIFDFVGYQHCDQAISYRDVSGKIRYKCAHQVYEGRSK